MERRTRQRKINYSELLADDSGDSEDDFVSAPPLKKSKDKKAGKEAQSNVQKSTHSPKVRLSRDEKQFNRQLEQAISMSKTTQLDGKKKTVVVSEAPNESVSSELSLSSEAPNESVRSELSVASESTLKSEGGGDSDFVPPNEEAASSDESFSGEDESDSDFDSSLPKKKTGAKKDNKKKNSATLAKNKTPVNKKPSKETVSKATNLNKPGLRATKRTPKSSAPPSAQTISTSIETTTKSTKPISSTKAPKVNAAPSSSLTVKSSPALGISRAIPKWTPPARIGSSTPAAKKSPQVLNGSSPMIRVGLSRNARVKPLHATSAKS